MDNRVLGNLLEVFSGNVLIAHDEAHVLWIPRGGAGDMEILDKLFQSPIRNVVHRLVAFLHRNKTCGETRLVGTFSKLTVKVARAGDIYNPVFNLIVAKLLVTSPQLHSLSVASCDSQNQARKTI